METCQNCGRVIGNLETPYLFQSRMVCKECNERLAPEIALAQAVSGGAGGEAAAMLPLPVAPLSYYAPAVGQGFVERRRRVVPFLVVAILMFTAWAVLEYQMFFQTRAGMVGDSYMITIASGVLFLLLAIPALVLWLVWVHGAHRDIQALSGGEYKIPPAQAVGFSLIPLFDAFWIVYMPWRLAGELNRHLAARGLKRVSGGAVMSCQIISVVTACFLPGITALLYFVSMLNVQRGLNRLVREKGA